MELTPSVYFGLLGIGAINVGIGVYALYYYTTKTPKSQGYRIVHNTSLPQQSCGLYTFH